MDQTSPRVGDTWFERPTGLHLKITEIGWDYHIAKVVETDKECLIQPTHFQTSNYELVDRP